MQTLQRRIESRDYPPGENQLIQEFGVSRPTVVAALRVQREQGWIESQQGKGRFVRGRPAMASIEQNALDRPTSPSRRSTPRARLSKWARWPHRTGLPCCSMRSPRARRSYVGG
ncbi:GntR family transcriptional regulator [Nonomuraea sp. C10]|uniref:GntR family transcriptional regulator n=1 Tax=Nonomuraea sp. C10 TaxID=2600577 RepID=UPI001C9CF4AE|nr:GntR family transcriptional regulator [Nonomuraea sp. C10]